MLIRKIQKNKKNQIYKKKELRDQVRNPTIFLPIHIGLHNTHREGNFAHFGGNTNKTQTLNLTLKLHLLQAAASSFGKGNPHRNTHPHGSHIFFFFSSQQHRAPPFDFLLPQPPDTNPSAISSLPHFPLPNVISFSLSPNTAVPLTRPLPSQPRQPPLISLIPFLAVPLFQLKIRELSPLHFSLNPSTAGDREATPEPQTDLPRDISASAPPPVSTIIDR
jgi:hypothetical protein